LDNIEAVMAEQKDEQSELLEVVEDLKQQKAQLESSVAEAEMRVKLRDSKQDEFLSWLVETFGYTFFF
jgi:peptidyl-tRNA hydrolase